MYTNNETLPNQPPPKNSSAKSFPFIFSAQRGKTRRRKHFPDEAPVQPNELADEYYRYYRPASTAERDLIDSIVENEWLARDLELIDREAAEKTVAFVNYDPYEP
jgi:hypothetical protein